MRVHKRLSVPVTATLPVAEHRQAVDRMERLSRMLLKGADVSQTSRTALICCGIACMRRVYAEVESDEGVGLLHTTMGLLFTLLVLSNASVSMREPDEYEELTDAQKALPVPPRPQRILRDDEHLLAAWGAACLADAVVEREAAHASSWAAVLRSDANVAAAALREAQYLPDGLECVDRLRELALIFFRSSAAAMAASLMANTQPTSGGRFVSLNAVGSLNRANNHPDQNLASIVDAAESEAGQAAVRDMILSFKLPSRVVGMRRTLLLSREINACATKSYTETLNAAHDAAMRGSNWSWASDSDPIHKISAVLAGLAVILAQTSDNVRKGDAFMGRVTLPFIECKPPDSQNAPKLGLLPQSGEWIVYKVSKAGQPTVMCRATGFHGFCECALLFSSSIRT